MKKSAVALVVLASLTILGCRAQGRNYAISKTFASLAQSAILRLVAAGAVPGEPSFTKVEEPVLLAGKQARNPDSRSATGIATAALTERIPTVAIERHIVMTHGNPAQAFLSPDTDPGVPLKIRIKTPSGEKIIMIARASHESLRPRPAACTATEKG